MIKVKRAKQTLYASVCYPCQQNSANKYHQNKSFQSTNAKLTTKVINSRLNFFNVYEDHLDDLKR